jgi:hypothetical protein
MQQRSNAPPPKMAGEVHCFNKGKTINLAVEARGELKSVCAKQGLSHASLCLLGAATKEDGSGVRWSLLHFTRCANGSFEVCL